MNMQTAVKTCLTKYVEFKGRAPRSEYWWFILFTTIVGIITLYFGQTIYSIVALILFLPSLAVLVRRLHDINRTGWWALIVLVPVIGFFVILYFALCPSDPAPNQYGAPVA